MPLDLRAARARELYDRLPEVYRARDWQRAAELFGDARVRAGIAKPELETVLGLVADQILRLRDHIGDLWDDFFIETCADWVVPYLGDLLGVNLVFNAAQRNRIDVKNTIDWRRRKGTLRMLAELAGDITGWGAAAAEFFEDLGWAQNLNHIKLDHVQAPDLRDPYPLSLLDTAHDPWLHAVDVRRPEGSVGRYGIKTVGFFLARLNAYPLGGVTPRAQGTVAGAFTFDPLGRDVLLFDRAGRLPITAPAYARDPYAFFGSKRGFAVRQHGILVASDRPATPEPTEVAAMWSDFGPANMGGPAVGLSAAGLEWMEPEKFETPMRRFKLTALWGRDFADPGMVTLGTLTSFPGTFTFGAAAPSPGVFMLRLELDAGSDSALFPATLLAVRNDRVDRRVADSREGRYRDVLYIYLPEVSLDPGNVLNLHVAADGSTFYAVRAAPHVGPADVTPNDILNPSLDRTLLARAGLGQCVPTRRLTYLLEPSEIANLHRVAGLRLADEHLFQGAGRKFLIEARMYVQDLTRINSPDNLVGQLPTYDDLGAGLSAFHYKPNPAISIGEGDRIVLKLSRAPASTDTFFPMTDLIVTDRGGQALLVALPELDFDSAANPAFSQPAWLFFDTGGATYYASTDFGHDTALGKPERGSAIRLDPQEVNAGLARKSAGQVLALPGKFPLQQRTPLYADLCHWDHPKPRPPRSGQLAVDPERGRVCFATGEVPATPLDGGLLALGMDYHEGFMHDVGALTYDRYASLKPPENPAPTRYVARSGDGDCGPAPVHATLAEALIAAEDGDVIQIQDNATYEQSADLAVPASVRRLVIQAANRQRPCLRFTGGARLIVAGAMEMLRLNGLLISGAALEIADASQVSQVELIGCTFDPNAKDVALIAGEGVSPKPLAQISLCRCIAGGLKLGRGVAELVVSDSILDRKDRVAIGDLTGGEAHLLAHLERTTIWGMAAVHQLYGSECLLLDLFAVGNRQAGCLRYSRYQVGSRLPRRFQCVPADNDLAANPVTPAFNSRRFGRPDYAQLHPACPEVVLTGAENGSEMGAFVGALAALREKNLGLKLDEYLPVGLKAALIDVT
jgi:hypothetical protein